MSASHGTRCNRQSISCTAASNAARSASGSGAKRTGPHLYFWNFQRCNALQCVAMRCNALQCAAMLHISHREKALSTRPTAQNKQQSTAYDYHCDSCKQESVEEPSPIRLHDAINLWQCSNSQHPIGQLGIIWDHLWVCVNTQSQKYQKCQTHFTHHSPIIHQVEASFHVEVCLARHGCEPKRSVEASVRPPWPSAAPGTSDIGRYQMNLKWCYQMDVARDVINIIYI